MSLAEIFSRESGVSVREFFAAFYECQVGSGDAAWQESGQAQDKQRSHQSTSQSLKP